MKPNHYSLSRKLRVIAADVEKAVNRAAEAKMCFALLIFDRAGGDVAPEQGKFQYVSNADRREIREALRTILAKWDNEALHVPEHDKQ